MKFNFKTVKIFVTCLALTAAFGCSEKKEEAKPTKSAECYEKHYDLIESSRVNLGTLTIASCEAHKANIRAFYKSCPDFLSADRRKGYDNFLTTVCKDV